MINCEENVASYLQHRLLSYYLVLAVLNNVVCLLVCLVEEEIQCAGGGDEGIETAVRN